MDVVQTSEMNPAPTEDAVPRTVSFREAAWTWARIAALSFGGPAGQIAVMHRLLVEEKHWIGETRFLHALNYCMLLPGPEAHQLAVYIGWLLHRVRGGIVAGTLFVLPGLISLGILSWIYAVYGEVGFVGALFFGLKSAVFAVVLEAVWRVGKRALKTRAALAVAALAFVAIFFFAVPFPVVVAGAALIGFVTGRSAWAQSSGHGSAKKAGNGCRGRDRSEFCNCNSRSREAVLAAFRVHIVRGIADLAGAVGRPLRRRRAEQRVHGDHRLQQQDGGRHLRRRIRGVELYGAAGGRTLSLAQAR